MHGRVYRRMDVFSSINTTMVLCLFGYLFSSIWHSHCFLNWVLYLKMTSSIFHFSSTDQLTFSIVYESHIYIIWNCSLLHSNLCFFDVFKVNSWPLVICMIPKTSFVHSTKEQLFLVMFPIYSKPFGARSEGKLFFVSPLKSPSTSHCMNAIMFTRKSWFVKPFSK